MKRKIIFSIILSIIIAFVAYELYLYNAYEANIVIRLYNCSHEEPVLDVDIKIDEFKSESASVEHITCHEWVQFNYNLAIGNHVINIKRKDSQDVVFSESFTLIFIKVIDITYYGDGNFEYHTHMSIPSTI